MCSSSSSIESTTKTETASSDRGSSTIPGTRWTPSSTSDQSSSSARSDEAPTPTSTFRACCTKPYSTGSSASGYTSPASKLDWWMAGMNAREKKARIVCRTKSVDVTRVMPKRYASSVATVDLPVPVAPADEDHDRQVELPELLVAAEALDRLASLLLAEHVDRERLEPLELDPPLAALAELVVHAARQRVRPVPGHSGGHQ